MNSFDSIQILITFLFLIFISPILGKYIYQVLESKPHFLSSSFGWLESIFARQMKTGYTKEMGWKEYAINLLIFNFFGFLILMILQLLQYQLPLNPQGLNNVSWHLALNTAISFMTNTNWQSYAGETTMSYFTQMMGFTVQNFLSAATGIAVAVALARGIARKQSKTIGNFWADINRSIVYVLLPLSIILSLVLVSEGVVQNFSNYVTATTIEGKTQILPQGPAASQIAIKQLGTNGGGFFNANSAHPYESPTPFSNWLQLISILLIPAALVFSYGHFIKNQRQALVIFSVMMTLLICGLGISIYSEYSINPLFANHNPMEGKETRFGVINSLMWSTFTTAASNGSVNSMHSSLSPMAGGVAMFNIMLGEIIFGGAGAGLYGMLMFILLTIFLSGLMVGRTPEYQGKKIEAFDIKMVILALILPSAVILLGAGFASISKVALSSLSSQGPHGLSELLYAFTSAAGNNGSAFAGLNANTPFYNLALAVSMLIGRFGVILPALAIAGSLASKKHSPANAGTLNADGPLFGFLLIAVIIVVGGLTFFPALSLGPIVEHLLLQLGRTF